MTTAMPAMTAAAADNSRQSLRCNGPPQQVAPDCGPGYALLTIGYLGVRARSHEALDDKDSVEGLKRSGIGSGRGSESSVHQGTERCSGLALSEAVHGQWNDSE